MLNRSTALLLAALLAVPCALAETEPGLLVRFYELDGQTHQMPELAPDQLPSAVKIFPTLELRTDRGDFKPFEDNFYGEVEGFLTIDKPGDYGFRLMSDDGSMLWIDDQLVIDNDGPHSGEPKDGSIELTAGQHALTVKYYEGGGDQKLELQWKPAAAGDFAPIPPAAFSHDKAAPREAAPGKKKMIPPLRRGLPGDGTPVAGMHPGYKVELVDIEVAQAAMDKPYKNAAGSSTNERGTSTCSLSRPYGRMMTIINDEMCARFLEPAATDPAEYLNQHFINSEPGSHELYRLYLDVLTKFTNAVRFRCAAASYNGFILNNINDDNVRYYCPNITNPSMNQVADKVWRLTPTKRLAFEMLAVRAMSNGFEIEFAKPLDNRCGWEPVTYYVEQWPFISDLDSTSEQMKTAPHRDGVVYPVKSASVSPDRKKVFLEIENLKPSHVVYLRLLPPCYSEDGERPWSTEAWYTLNAIPQERKGQVLKPPAPEPQNVVTEQEKAEGWKLLFDGKSGAGWHGYRKDSFPAGWQAKDGSLVRCGSAGDISTDGEYANFELKIDWRVTSGANSGIFYRVNEEFDWPFFSGPEYQILDNAEHADGKNPLTSAASNYALVAPTRDATAPVGYFNQARIVMNGPHVEHWLNGEKVVEYELWTDAWKGLVAGSKFNAWKNYGLMKTGRIVLQDHGDMVWFRNIKIRELPDAGEKVTK